MTWDRLFNLFFLAGWFPFLLISVFLYRQVRKDYPKLTTIPLILVVLGLAWFLDALVVYIMNHR